MRQFGRLPFQNLPRGGLFWQSFCIIGKSMDFPMIQNPSGGMHKSKEEEGIVYVFDD